MALRIAKLDASRPEEAVLTEAAAILRAGGIVAFPTETVYGLGADAFDAHAVNRIFEVKGRPPNNPLIVHIAEREAVGEVAGSWPDAAERLSQRFWPGPLTLVVNRNPALPSIVTAGGPTVAVRMSSHPVASGLIRAAGFPIAAPSANRSGEISPTTAEHVLRSLGGRIDLILDAGPTQVGLESTVLDVSQSPPRLLRPGHVSRAEIEALIGTIVWSEVRENVSSAAMPSPGMLAKHYAPHTPTECVNPPAIDRVRLLITSGKRVGWLAFGAPAERIPAAVLVIMPQRPPAYAVRLYAELHRLDQMGLDRIVVEWPPNTEEWLAVRDRLQRASAHD
jgi:L-threonylcarbamoyladenylate synthase